ncbi:hypothetical protein JIQ42_07179 [Leishmania sp. Namibia]|uniref:hypothetical protein n=1 Tax=Leishmania sp. Namibia TaxID=2802991 RepID=UPI001B66C05D|nr:hypothetical protein JIQ42_07179 [Leishmania sp. Namibia]
MSAVSSWGRSARGADHVPHIPHSAWRDLHLRLSLPLLPLISVANAASWSEGEWGGQLWSRQRGACGSRTLPYPPQPPPPPIRHITLRRSCTTAAYFSFTALVSNITKSIRMPLSLMSSPPPTAGAARSTATPPSTPDPSFTSFVLERVSRNPFLINETPRSLRPPSPQTAAEDAPLIPSTLDAAQRAVIAQASISGSVTTSIPASASTSAATAVLQRALIDAPLLPVGGCHLLHELVWPHLLASAEAAKQLSNYRKALQLYDARQALSTTDTNAPLQGQQPHRTEATSLTTDSELKKTVAGAAADIFAASPLASPLTDDQHQSNQGVGASLSTGTAGLLRTPEELSQSWTRDALQANMEQALTRLTGSRRELQRGLKKLRRILDGLRAYDVVPFDELEARRQEAVRNLFTPVVVATAGDCARENGNMRSDHAVLATEVAAAAARGTSTVLGSADAVADRKRPREP